MAIVTVPANVSGEISDNLPELKDIITISRNFQPDSLPEIFPLGGMIDFLVGK